MKKIIALILAIVMIASMSVVAFAANGETNSLLEDELGEGENRDLKDDQEAVDVIYDVRMGYEVIIPGTFNLTEVPNDDGSTHGEGSGLVIITMAKLPGGKSLTVKATSTNAMIDGSTDGNWTLAVDGTNDKLAYKIAVEGDGTGADYDTTDLGRQESNNTIVSHTSGTDDAILPYEAGQDGAASTGGRRATLTITTADNDVAGYFQDVITFKTAVN